MGISRYCPVKTSSHSLGLAADDDSRSGATPATSCARLIPTHPNQSPHLLSSDPFMIAPSSHHKQQHPRPALRPASTHNAIFPLPYYPRRMMPNVDAPPASTTSVATAAPSAGSNLINTHATAGPSVNGAARPATAGTVLDSSSTSIEYATNELSTSAPSTSTPLHVPTATSHQHGIHEAPNGAPFATMPPINGSHSTPTYPPTHTSMPIHNGTTYSDSADVSFSTSYNYDTSFSSASTGSPWLQQPHHGSSPHMPAQHQVMPPQYYGHPLYELYPVGKQLEPILAPGEIPAPRPQMSYAALIGEALLLAAAPHHLYVSEISDSIKKRYACEFARLVGSICTCWNTDPQTIAKTLPKYTTGSAIRPRCAKPLSSCPVRLAISLAVRASGPSEPAAKLGSPTEATTHLDHPLLPARPLRNTNPLVKPSRPPEPSSSR